MKNCLDLLSDAYLMILNVKNVKSIYIITGRTDFRKGMLSLAVVVRESLFLMLCLSFLIELENQSRFFIGASTVLNCILRPLPTNLNINGPMMKTKLC